MAKARYHYNVMLRPEPEGGYTALVPALPGCVTYGRTMDEARALARDAISGYIASLRKHDEPVPFNCPPPPAASESLSPASAFPRRTSGIRQTSGSVRSTGQASV